MEALVAKGTSPKGLPAHYHKDGTLAIGSYRLAPEDVDRLIAERPAPKAKKPAKTAAKAEPAPEPAPEN